MTKVGPRLRCRAGIVALLAFSMLGGVARPQAAVFSADAVKAAFLYRFASYVEWPAEAPAGPLVIAVAGAEDVARQLEELLPRVKVKGGVPQVRRIARASELDGVHILYVGPDALTRTRTLRREALDRPILVVTDDPRGFEYGAVINFIEVERNLRFEISQVAADRARLKIDSALLSVAVRVERRPQGWIPCRGKADCAMHLAAAGSGSWP